MTAARGDTVQSVDFLTKVKAGLIWISNHKFRIILALCAWGMLGDPISDYGRMEVLGVSRNGPDLEYELALYGWPARDSTTKEGRSAPIMLSAQFESNKNLSFGYLEGRSEFASQKKENSDLLGLTAATKVTFLVNCQNFNELGIEKSVPGSNQYRASKRPEFRIHIVYSRIALLSARLFWKDLKVDVDEDSRRLCMAQPSVPPGHGQD